MADNIKTSNLSAYLLNEYATIKNSNSSVYVLGDKDNKAYNSNLLLYIADNLRNGVQVSNENIYILSNTPSRGTVDVGSVTWDSYNGKINIGGSILTMGSGVLDYGHLISSTSTLPILMINDNFVTNDFNGNWTFDNVDDWIIRDKIDGSDGYCIVPNPSIVKSYTIHGASSVITGPVTMNCNYFFNNDQSVQYIRILIDGVEKIRTGYTTPCVWKPLSVTIPELLKTK